MYVLQAARYTLLTTLFQRNGRQSLHDQDWLNYLAVLQILQSLCEVFKFVKGEEFVERIYT